MNGITSTRFGDFDDPKKMAKQLATAVNNLESILSMMPIYFGVSDPNGSVVASTGSIYIRQGDQGVNSAVATPKLYLKTVNQGSGGWLALVYTGEQAQTDVSAFRGSLYFKIPSELASSAALYLKTSDDAATTGWTAL